MQEPRRGEVFRLKMHGRVGTELRGDRFCVVVSDERFHNRYPHVTVAPLTSYAWEREYSRPLWSVIVQQADSMINVSDVNIDSHNAECPYGQLEIWETDDQGNQIRDQRGNRTPYRSIIDCGQLICAWSFNPLQYPQLSKDLREIGWDMRHGLHNILFATPLCRLIEASQSRRRQRFTIAHEIGHDVLHANTDGIFCKVRVIGREEREANYFAARLLMPSELVLMLWNEILKRMPRLSPSERINEMADRFYVSSKAMRICLEELELLPRQKKFQTKR